MSAIPPQLVGDSAAFHALLDWVSAIASIDKPVLITGERGTGKTLLASRLHFLSKRWETAYVAFDCAAFDAQMQADILFGDETGSSALERAEGGTLFLDNIDHLAAHLQQRLIPLVEYGVYDAGEGGGADPYNIRLIAAMQTGRSSKTPNPSMLNAALGDVITFDTVEIPPLRGRPEDIEALLRYFGRKMTAALGAESYPGISAELSERFMRYPWPGNVRELKTVIERAVTRSFLADESLKTPIAQAEMNVVFDLADKPDKEREPPSRPADIDSEHTRQAGPAQPSSYDFSGRVMEFERRLIDEALSQSSEHQGRAAEYLNLTYHQFRGLLRKHGLKK